MASAAPGGKAPSLSSLQASLSVAKRPATAAKAPVTKAAVAKTPVAKTAVAKTVVAKSPGKVAVSVAKAPVEKAAVSKPSIAKAPVAKANVANVAKAPVGKAPVAKAPVAKAPVAKAASAPSAAPVVGQKRPAPAEADGAPAAKKVAASPAKATAAGTPAAKAPAAASSPAAGKPAAAGPLVGAGVEDKALSAAIQGLLDAVEAAPAAAKVQGVVTLADTLGTKLQIDHINHFLRTLKKKVIERAQGDGIRVQASSQQKAAAPAPPAATSKQAPPVPGATVAKKAGAPSPDALPGVTGKAGPGAFSKGGPPPPARPAPPVKSSGTTAKAPAATAKAAPAEETPPEPAASPTASPPPEVDDPLYVLVGSFVDDPVHRDGALVEARLSAVLKQLWEGVAKKPKDWATAFQKMEIPVDKQGEALQRFFNMTFAMEGEDPEKAPSVVAELVKNHRIKLRSVEEVLVTFGNNLDGLLAMNEDAWHVYSYFLMHVFPKPQVAGWGWSRVGWSWQSWWQFVEKCVGSMEAARQFDVVALLLKLIQDREGTALGEVAAWQEGDKLGRAIAKLGEMCDMADGEVVEKLAEAGVTVEV